MAKDQQVTANQESVPLRPDEVKLALQLVSHRYDRVLSVLMLMCSRTGRRNETSNTAAMLFVDSYHGLILMAGCW